MAKSPIEPEHGAAALALLLAALTSCASPSARFDREADHLGLERSIELGSSFAHVVYSRGALCDAHSRSILHVYLGGDGTPKLAGLPTSDPTPRVPLALHLLAMDSGPSVYLGRPCYHGLAGTRHCEKQLWTTARYSEPVVSSLEAAALQLLEARDCNRIAWFGYSGGGVLAMLLAGRIVETQSVVTIAANLDVTAWTRHHGHAPLTGSVNPRTRAPLPRTLRQLHYAGEHDAVVPPAMTVRGLTNQTAGLTVIRGYDHVCCWRDIWPDVLAQVALAKDQKSTRTPIAPP